MDQKAIFQPATCLGLKNGCKSLLSLKMPGSKVTGQPAEKSRFYYLSDSNATQILAFIGGFVDAAGYLKLQGVFTSSITGNLVVACAALSSFKLQGVFTSSINANLAVAFSSFSSLTGVACRSCVCLAFTFAGGLLSLLAIELKHSFSCSQGTVSVVLFLFEALALIVVWIIGLDLVQHPCKLSSLPANRQG